jgi:hypothetical protein
MVRERNGRWYIEIYDPETGRSASSTRARFASSGLTQRRANGRPSRSSVALHRRAIAVATRRRALADAQEHTQSIIGGGTVALRR